MELRTLKVFVEVVRRGGFTEAGKSVFLTQSSVSKAIKHLEDELGVPLLDRSARRATPTAAGEIVYRRAIRMLSEQADLLGELAELRGMQRGSLRLGLPVVGSDMLFAPLFAIYKTRFPGIEISLIENASRQLEELVRTGEVDIGTSLLPVSEDFSWQSVRDEPLDVLLPVDHPLAALESVDLAQLRELPFVLFENGFALNSVILAACRSAGFSPNITARSSQVTFIRELVGLGLGVGFLPRFIAKDGSNPKVRNVTINNEQMIWRMAWIWRREANLSLAARAWLSLAVE